MPRTGPKIIMVVGSLTAAVAMLSLTRIDATTSFVGHLLPAQVLLGLGLGFTFVPLSSLALVGVPEHDAGAASATLNATQQIGGSLGTALLNTMFASALTAYVADHATSARPDRALLADAEVHGYTVAFAWGGGLILLAALIIIRMIKVRKEDLPAQPVVHAG
jgi:MFS family permease